MKRCRKAPLTFHQKTTKNTYLILFKHILTIKEDSSHFSKGPKTQQANQPLIAKLHYLKSSFKHIVKNNF